MRKKLNNVRSKDGYRQYCCNCGRLCMTTAFPVYPDRRAFCNQTCYKERYSPANIARTVGLILGYPIATIGPFIALFKVVEHFEWTGLGLLAGVGAFAVTCCVVTWPIFRWLER